MLDDEALPDQLSEHPVEALLGDAQDAEQVADRHLRMPPDEMDDPVMRPAKAELRKDRIGLGGEIAIGEEQQLDAVPHLLLAQRKLIHPRFLVAGFDRKSTRLDSSH